MIAERPPRCQWQSSIKVGGCNFCISHITTGPPGQQAHEVLVVYGNAIMVRFCRACWEKVVAAGGGSRPLTASKSSV